MRIISWNVGNQTKSQICEAQIKVISDYDIIALQEVNSDAYPFFLKGLQNSSFDVLCSISQDTRLQKSSRRRGVLTASRLKMQRIPFSAPWPEKALSVSVHSEQWGDIEIHNVHVPNGSNNGLTKVKTLEAIYRQLACNVRRHRILCGDFNSPQEETTDGHVITWGQKWRNSWKRYLIPTGWERWDRAERDVLVGLQRYDLKDAFRLLHGYKRKEFSHWNNKAKKIGRRYDHVFMSSALMPKNCEYLNKFKELSDHLPIAVLL